MSNLIFYVNCFMYMSHLKINIHVSVFVHVYRYIFLAHLSVPAQKYPKVTKYMK